MCKRVFVLVCDCEHGFRKWTQLYEKNLRVESLLYSELNHFIGFKHSTVTFFQTFIFSSRTFYTFMAFERF